MGSWERERRYQEQDHEEEEPLLRRGPSPGKRSLTHRFIGADWMASDESVDAGAAPDARVRAQVEGATGADLSDARVHLGTDSQVEAAALRAKAFTVGRDIHFAAGQYQPGTPAGDALLAHELVHTLQQSGGEPTAQLKSSDVSQEGDAAEVEADRIAHAAVSGAAVRMVPVARAAPISRTPESLSGNPAEKTDPTTGAATTSHRSVGVGDSANAPPTGTPGTAARTTNVKPKATEAAPMHVAGAVCPVESAIYEEDASGATPAPAGFTQVTGFQGTTAAPMVTQEASKGIYINGSPAIEDIQQGGIGDCYFLALVGSIIGRDPGKIPSIMASDGNGGATVTLWRAQAHSPSIWERITGGAPARDWIQVAVTVTDQLAVNVSNNRVHGAQMRCAPNPMAQDWWAKVVAPNLEIHRKDTFEVARWAPLLEKAYARFSQNHDNNGGARPNGNRAPSGYAAINGGWSHEVMCVFYGPACDDPATAPQYQNTAWTPGGNVVSANAAAMDQLILLQGRGTQAGAGDTNAPLVQATSSVDPLIGRLQAAIPVAQADPDYAKVDATRQALVASVALSIVTWNGLPADPPAPAAQPKSIAKRGIGTACVNAVRPGIDESAGEQQVLAGMRTWASSPITFNQGESTITAGTPNETNLKNLNSWLKFYQSPQVQVSLEGHSSAEGTEADNQTLSQTRVDSVETTLLAGGAIAPHTTAKNAVGERGATRDPAWRRVDVAVNPTGHKTNSLLDGARSRSIREMTDLMVDLRNIGTDNSTGQRNIYGDHVYTVMAVSIVTTTGINVPLNAMPAGASRAALYPLVDPNVSTVTLRNPHHGNEPDRRNNQTPQRPGDGAPSGASSDGVFTMTLSDFFLHFTSVQSGVFPRT